MVRVIDQIRTMCAVLVFGIVVMLGFGALSQAMPFGDDARRHEPAVHQMGGTDMASADAACADGHADNCFTAQACCGVCAALAIQEATGVPAGSNDAWGMSPRHVLSGLEPLVNRHPPRASA
jgi:hypothetical protein